MDGSDSVLWFLGDLNDPWVEAIAASVPACWKVEQTHCAESLPERIVSVEHPPAVIVLHRNRLTTRDAERIQGWRDAAVVSDSPLSPADVIGPRIVLCASPYLRYEEIERSSSLMDDVIAEATAVDVLPLRLARLLNPQRARKASADPSPRIDVVSGDEELREMLVDLCMRAGYSARAINDRFAVRSTRPDVPSGNSSTTERVLTIWDLPVLEPDWPERLEMYQRMSEPVITLSGFVDRQIVTTAKSRGAMACLDLPCDNSDLLDLIERCAHVSHPGVRFDHAHHVPPTIRLPENTRPPRWNVVTPPWPETARSSTISKTS
jgi:hypothetical protein